MTVYLQRQFAGWLAAGDDTDPVVFPPQSRVWDMRDVYPSNVLQMDSGLQNSFETTIDTLGSLTVQLPQLYDSAEKLAVLIRGNKLLKIVTVIPVAGTSTALLRPGLATDQNGVHCFCGRVTSITITNTSADTATVQYFLYQMPDLTLAASWEQGYQVTGVVVTQ